MHRGAPQNPFSTCHHRPGAVPFRCGAGSSVDGLLDELAQRPAEGQIVGAEGTGKTTLLCELARRAAERGWVVARARAPHVAVRATARSGAAPSLLCLDEADALGWRQLRSLRHDLGRRGGRLAVTTHRDLGLPTIVRCQVSPQLAIEVARTVLERSPQLPELVVPEEAAAALHACRGNLREALLLLYDWYEDRWAARCGTGGARPKMAPSHRAPCVANWSG